MCAFCTCKLTIFHLSDLLIKRVYHSDMDWDSMECMLFCRLNLSSYRRPQEKKSCNTDNLNRIHPLLLAGCPALSKYTRNVRMSFHVPCTWHYCKIKTAVADLCTWFLSQDTIFYLIIS